MVRASWYLTGTVSYTKVRLAVPAQTDSRGNDVYTETAATLTDVNYEPRLSAGSEEADRQQHVEEGLDLFCGDPDCDVAETDRFSIDGGTWHVSSAIKRYRDSRMNNNYAHIILRLVNG
jgi:hypothetical protein